MFHIFKRIPYGNFPTSVVKTVAYTAASKETSSGISTMKLLVHGNYSKKTLSLPQRKRSRSPLQDQLVNAVERNNRR
jgi:hypothetical protein